MPVSANACDSPSMRPAFVHPIGPAPYSDDPIATARRDATDYSIKVTLEEAYAGKAKRQVRVYADGVYDMFHFGHARQLMEAKTAFPPETDVYLIVGMNSDVETHAFKGKTVNTEDERYEVIRHCRYVDEINRAGPFFPDEEFIASNKIDFIAHDETPYAYADGCGDAYEWVKQKGMFLATHKTPDISTTKVITRIISDYDAYLIRNLKRGCSKTELGVGFVKGQQLKLQETTEAARCKAHNVIEHWESLSRDFIGSFIGMFDRGSIGNWLRSNQRLPSPPLDAVSGVVSVTSCDDTDSFADEFDVAEALNLEFEHV